MSKFTDYVTSMNPLITNTNNKFVQVLSPITVRAVGKTINDPPNPVNFFLRFNSGTFTNEDFGNAIAFTNAADPSISITSLDDFLKTLPSSGGGIPPLIIRSV